MQSRGIGISLVSNESVGNIELLKKKLEKAEEIGFDSVELPIQGMKIIRNGEIDGHRLNAYAEVLKQYSLRYTTHAPFDINLFRSADREIDRKCFIASLEISGALEAATMVYHVGRYIGEEHFLYKDQWPLYNDREKQLLLSEERSFLQYAGEMATGLNVRIGMENMRPYLDCPDYCYSVIPSVLAEQVRHINHPNVGITLDTGHAFLASNMYQLDLQAEVDAIRPYVVHLHVHDNFGRPCFSTEKNQYELYTLGRGDMHMPIGDGAVPMTEIARWLGGAVDGYMVHEIREMYEPQWHTLLNRTQRHSGGSFGTPSVSLTGSNLCRPAARFESSPWRRQ
ncbi:sugar phosphate isomerase/epimerase family protein [Paenibacillus alkalitolerans]|uniref:sugar phosphate isomerase/epimerase family protein n=1 Tax=Paenibacillus alkalitolerans TaxID=2799335 RepID=UPI0018F5EDA4|nr:sugar phosphate isomerase/epimerase family protein [Paenibacillus alkalitolerans]